VVKNDLDGKQELNNPEIQPTKQIISQIWEYLILQKYRQVNQ